ncbi:MAG: hypothetical protein QGG09_11035, partial [Pirellulaceae bacterium]|nr:hypothetical protein [Pirellulaceae bacterium]
TSLLRLRILNVGQSRNARERDWVPREHGDAGEIADNVVQVRFNGMPKGQSFRESVRIMVATPDNARPP